MILNLAVRWRALSPSFVCATTGKFIIEKIRIYWGVRRAACDVAMNTADFIIFITRIPDNPEIIQKNNDKQLPRNCSEIALKLPQNCSENAAAVPLKLIGKRPEIAMKLHRNCPKIALKLL